MGALGRRWTQPDSPEVRCSPSRSSTIEVNIAIPGSPCDRLQTSMSINTRAQHLTFQEGFRNRRCSRRREPSRVGRSIGIGPKVQSIAVSFSGSLVDDGFLLLDSPAEFARIPGVFLPFAPPWYAESSRQVAAAPVGSYAMHDATGQRTLPRSRRSGGSR